VCIGSSNKRAKFRTELEKIRQTHGAKENFLGEEEAKTYER
jgi:hypothetical protein